MICSIRRVAALVVFTITAVLFVSAGSAAVNETLTSPDPTVIHCLDSFNCTTGNESRYETVDGARQAYPTDATVPVQESDDEPTFWCPENYHPMKMESTWYHLCRPRSCANVSSDQVDSLVGAKSYATFPGRNGTTVELVCKKSSPTFSECPKKMLTGSQFRQTDGGRMTDADNTFVAELGNYFQRANELIVCDPSNGTEVGVVVAESPASCSPFLVSKTRFRVLANGTGLVDGVHIQVPRKSYAHSRDGVSLDICFPMDPMFTTCQRSPLEREYIRLQPADLSLFTDDTVELIYPVGTFILAQDNSSAIVCIEAGDQTSAESKISYGVLALISSLFLLLSLLAHLWIPNLNYHTKALLCLLFAMLGLYVTLAVRNFIFHMISWGSFMVLFSLQYIFGLSAFFWLNILAFDLWYVFANQNGIMTQGSLRGKKRRFFIKCGYAWGVPVLLCAAVLGINGSESAQRALNLQLDIGGTGWFHSTKSIFIFFYVPIIIILIENVIFFALTIVNIRKASKGTDILNKRVSRQLLVVFAKLFVVMGICWFFEILSFALANRTSESAWYFTDSINLLQGVFIFFVYVFKRATIKIIRAKLGYPMENGGSQVTKSTSSSQQDNRKTSVASAGNQTKKKGVEMTTKVAEGKQNGGEREDCQTKC